MIGPRLSRGSRVAEGMFGPYRLDSQPIAISGTDDKTLRVWELAKRAD